jgi:hypothetical protein
MIAPRAHNVPARLDVLRGAKAIAVFMETTEKRIYALHGQRLLPLYVEGSTICARKSTLVAWIERQEAQGG